MADEERGFAGFNSMVSDLSNLPAIAAAPPQTASPTAQSADRPSLLENSSKTESTSSGSRWPNHLTYLIAALIVGGAAYWISQNTSKPSINSSSPMPSPSAQPSAMAAPPPPKRVSETEEALPPIGQDNLLTSAQIRYCVAQSFRLDGAERALDARSQAAVIRYNVLIDDFNSRCSKYRYRKGTLEPIQAEVGRRRTALEQEGAALVLPIRR